MDLEDEGTDAPDLLDNETIIETDNYILVKFATKKKLQTLHWQSPSC